MATQKQYTGENTVVRAVLRTGIALGIGLMGALDEIIFHQILQWHHFYIHTQPFWQIASDGFFHLFTTAMLFIGAVHLWSQRRRFSFVVSSRPFWAGIFVGSGAFQLFDGTVNHKLLQIHPVRLGVEDILPYDLGWNAFALILLLVGWLLWRRVRSEDSPSLD